MRTEKAFKNIIIALSGQIIGMILSFFTRSIFIKQMTEELLGVNSVFANLLSILSLAEMGIGSAITFSLYEPLAKKNTKKVAAIMNFYKFVYRIVALIVIFFGISIVPFLRFIIKEEISNLYLYYMLYLISTIISYLCAYKRTLLIADQNSYISSLYHNAYIILLNIFQINILIYTRSYFLFLIIQIILSFLENLLISWIADKKYPYIVNNKESLENSDKKNIFKNVKALMMHRVGSIVVTNTNVILLSSIVSIKAAAIYANYRLIFSGLTIVLTQIYSNLTASVGNLLVNNQKEYSYKIYKATIFVAIWLYGGISICLYTLLNDFIKIWIGNRFIETKVYIFILTIHFFLMGIREPTNIFKNAYGLFWNDRYKALIEAIVNIIFSILFGIKFGAVGIFGATLLTTLTIPFIIEPYVLYKYYWNKPLGCYIKIIIRYFFIIFVVGLILNIISNYIIVTGWFSFIVKGIIIFLLTNLLIYIFVYKKAEFELVREKIKVIVNKKILKRNSE